MSKPKAAVSWSGGKDSCLALHKVRNEFEVTTLVTMMTEDGSRSRSHGLRPEVLAAQAASMEVRLLTARASWEKYEMEFKTVLQSLRSTGVSHVIFGDIFPDSHREWAERVCATAGLEAIEPLWGQPTRMLVNEFLALGGRARIVAINRSKLDEEWLLRPLTPESIENLAALGIDPCGEYGEYHTVVEWGPDFGPPIYLAEAGRYEFSGYAGADLFVAHRSSE